MTRSEGLRTPGGLSAREFVWVWVTLLVTGCGVGGASPSPPSPAQRPGGEVSVPADGTPLVQNAPGPEVRISYREVNDSVRDQPKLAALVEPYRNRMSGELLRVIGEAATPLTKAVPEGTLGDFAADAMLWAAREAMDEPVDMAMTNNGGLRVPMAPGPITVEKIFELMPFDNLLSVLTLSGEQLQTMADELAEMRGEPIAGFSFRIEREGEGFAARDLLVGGMPVVPGRRYRLVTNDYLANGGEAPSPIHEPLARHDLPILLRDAFMAYVKEKKVIHYELEGRITGGIGR